jgi:hypothetical protein
MRTKHRVESALLGAFLAMGVALAFFAIPLTVMHERPTRFRISGDATRSLYPGGPAAPLDLAFDNPNDFAITVRGVKVSIAGAGTGCQVTDYAVVSQLADALPLPPDGTSSLSRLGIPRADWPRVAMVDSHHATDSCEGSSLRLSYSGRATQTAKR